MLRRIVIAALICIFISPILSAEDMQAPSNEEFATALTVIMDCVSASLVTECTDSGIVLPCSSIQIEGSTNLPKRLAYFLADPAEFMVSLTPKVEGTNKFLASVFSFLTSSAENPLVSAVYIAMSLRGYREGDFLLSGSITFDYPKGATLDGIIDVWSQRVGSCESILMNVDMQVYGNALGRPMTVCGEFEMHLSESGEGDIVISSIGAYTINGIAFVGGEFRF